MSKKIIQIAFFVVFTAILLVLLFFIFKPYFGVIFLSGVFAVAFYPLYKNVLREFNGRARIASFVTSSLILIFIIIPITVLSVLLLREAVNLYNGIVLGGGTQGFISNLNVWINNLNSQFFGINYRIDLEVYLRDLLNWIIGHFGSIFSIIFGGILNFLLMLISLYYLFVFGEDLKKTLIKWSPLPNQYDEQFLQSLRASMDAVFRGRILVSIAQGLLIGVGFVIFGVDSPVLWGFVGAIASLVPILGTSVITLPAVAYLAVTGHSAAAVGLLIWSTFIIGLIDNFLSALFIENKIKIHPLIVLFSILGGIEVFGFIGFLVGPVIVSTFIALMKIYPYIASNLNNNQE